MNCFLQYSTQYKLIGINGEVLTGSHYWEENISTYDTGYMDEDFEELEKEILSGRPLEREFASMIIRLHIEQKVGATCVEDMDIERGLVTHSDQTYTFGLMKIKVHNVTTKRTYFKGRYCPPAW